MSHIFLFPVPFLLIQVFLKAWLISSNPQLLYKIMINIIILFLFTPTKGFNYTLPSLLFSKIHNLKSENPDLLVKTQNGILEGTILPSVYNKTVTGFLGVPYAQPPIHDLRFRPPKVTSKWSGVKKADKQPPSCMQRFDISDLAQEINPSVPPSEDCLYLNIFVPNLPGRVHKGGRLDTLNSFPVLVYFHGGSFSKGSSLPHGPPQWTPDPRELASLG